MMCLLWYVGKGRVLRQAGSYCVDQAGLEPTDMPLPLPLSAEVGGSASQANTLCLTSDFT